jgi:hypothetical protein
MSERGLAAVPNSLPKAVAAAQFLVNRCSTAALRKELVIALHCCGSVDNEGTRLLITANQLETA